MTNKYKTITKEQVDALISYLAVAELAGIDSEGYALYTPKQILIGDVLEKMELNRCDEYCDSCEYIEGDNITTPSFLRYWKPCGFSNSLQEIVKNSNWEVVNKKRGDCLDCGRSVDYQYGCGCDEKTIMESVAVLKDKNADKLLTLLYGIFKEELK